MVDALGGSALSVQVARHLLRAGLRWRRDIAGFVRARAESGLHQELRVRPRQPVRGGTIPGSLEMQYDPFCFALSFAQPPGPSYAQPYLNLSSDLSRQQAQ